MKGVIIFTFFVIFEIATGQVLNYGSKPPNTNPGPTPINQPLNAAVNIANNYAATPTNQLNSAVNLGNGYQGPPLTNQPLNAAANMANSLNTAKVALNENTAINTLAALNTANVANEVAATNLAALAAATFAGNGNIATFNLNTEGLPFTITSGSPGSPGFGFQVLAEALEVGGKVNVNGEIPIFGTVSVNGNVPTDGTAAVSYSCGRTEG